MRLLKKRRGNNKTIIEQLKKAVDERYELHSTFVEEYKKLTRSTKRTL